VRSPTASSRVSSDQRWSISLFRDDVWPQVHDAVETFKQVSAREQVPLSHLALRWLLHQPAITSVLVSAKNKQQVLENRKALNLEIADSVLDELTRLSDAIQAIPDEGNPFGYHP
jgi:myo-inositol catabolism protein IolS